jgi:glutamine amidotransferase
MNASVAIVRYNAGNIQSLLFALARLGVEPIVTDDAERLRNADKVIFPGVGEARSAMTYLQARGLDAIITGLRQPVLGICIGMQLLCAHSEENDTECMGIFSPSLRKFVSDAGYPQRLKVPHIGWNTINFEPHPLFAGVPSGSFVYYVHSYAADIAPETIASTEYGLSFSGALHKDNFYAVQFHPEKSGEAGSRILQNFLAL